MRLEGRDRDVRDSSVSVTEAADRRSIVARNLFSPLVKQRARGYEAYRGNAARCHDRACEPGLAAPRWEHDDAPFRLSTPRE
jgi:hypothetical protein